ncbi:GNAT family N-acetyltransferase [Shimazuella alba]|uniref:GNAT family N-acetyltransferase n=1 Tax=Shimazuella alba TaxID=2690964 RepID=A0A6I4VU48_9BACL|nr:GNAT family N-acetyltransferase [Shimazuella alba]MXQ55319.1 GNAT family N-acetyltransferase [Shimazuella alba]
MDIFIREMRNEDQIKNMNVDESFIVDSALVLSAKGQEISYTIKEIPSYRKSYIGEPYEEMSMEDYFTYIDNPNQIIYFAFVENQVVGQIILKRNWNQYAYVEDIKVDARFRMHGIGRRLIEQAKQWARSHNMPGIMLETQNNNVRACKFYESCGFVIGGFDFCVYKGIDKQNDETAIYWYLMFE